MSEKRRDNKNRILRTGESQRADGKSVGISILLVYSLFKCEGITKQVFAIQ